MSTFLLVPGAGGDPWYWHRLVPFLEAAGAAAVVVDVPAADPTAGLTAYADAIAAAGAGHRDVVLVAQSMGGISAPLACDRLDVRHLAMVNAMVPRPGETGAQWWPATGQQEAHDEAARDAGRPTGSFDIEDFFHDVPDDVRAEAFARGERDQSERPFADPWPLPAWPEVPTTVLVGEEDRFFPPAFQRRVAGERLGLEAQLVPGGHLVALARPEPLAERLFVLADG